VSPFRSAGDALTMKSSSSVNTWTVGVLIAITLATAVFKTGAQDKPKRETIQAQAMGQNPLENEIEGTRGGHGHFRL
jgi:hypothetical protein